EEGIVRVEAPAAHLHVADRIGDAVEVAETNLHVPRIRNAAGVTSRPHLYLGVRRPGAVHHGAFDDALALLSVVEKHRTGPNRLAIEAIMLNRRVRPRLRAVSVV